MGEPLEKSLPSPLISLRIMDYHLSSVPGEKLRNFALANPAVKYIRLQWMDLSGILFARVVPKDRLLESTATSRDYNVGPGAMNGPCAGFEPSLTPATGFCTLKPDWASLRVCHYAPGHASVLCFTHYNGPRRFLPSCPRQILASILDSFKQHHKKGLLLGFEIEFVLLDVECKAPLTIDRIENWSGINGLRGPNMIMLEEIVTCLHDSGIVVEQFHADAENQLEISTGPLEPLEAIDALIYSLETIKTISVRHGMRTSLAPKPFVHGPTNSLHTHISLHPTEAKTMESFMAGILKHLPALCAVGMASLDSYARVKNFTNTVGTYVAWGWQNRECALRKISDEHWEMRFMDASANMYLAVAMTLATGMKGISEGLQLSVKDCQVRPGQISREALEDMGVKELLPQSLGDALECLQRDTVIIDSMGAEMETVYVSMKKEDVEIMEKMDFEERRMRFLKFY